MPEPAPSKALFKLGDQTFEVPLRPAWVMGIVNVTPDSFSDGGEYFDRDRAVARALEQVEQGARIIDIGAESTRPGATGVPAPEQIRRAIPVIEGFRAANTTISISIDTCLANVAKAALRAGANLVNDTSALRDDADMARVVAESHASLVLMHRRGMPADMQRGGGPSYDDVIREIAGFLRERLEFAMKHGVEPERIVLDPGMGFGKRSEDNLKLINEVAEFARLGRPVLIGASRKKFLGSLLNQSEPRHRLIGSVSCALIAAIRGASLIRAHDVAETVEALKILNSIDSA